MRSTIVALILALSLVACNQDSKPVSQDQGIVQAEAQASKPEHEDSGLHLGQSKDRSKLPQDRKEEAASTLTPNPTPSPSPVQSSQVLEASQCNWSDLEIANGENYADPARTEYRCEIRLYGNTEAHDLALFQDKTGYSVNMDTGYETMSWDLNPVSCVLTAQVHGQDREWTGPQFNAGSLTQFTQRNLVVGSTDTIYCQKYNTTRN